MDRLAQVIAGCTRIEPALSPQSARAFLEQRKGLGLVVVDAVSNRRLFHVTVTKPYKQAFTAGQIIEIGVIENPFFRFYESAREYPINDNGNLVIVKAIRWLSLVRQGQIAPHPGILPSIALEVAQHYVMLSRELIMEDLRIREFNSLPPSRQTCLYTCDTQDEAKHWVNRLGDAGASICELICTGMIHRADAMLLLGDSEPLSVTRDRGRRYWNGEASDHPEWETLFVGKAEVVSTGLEA